MLVEIEHASVTRGGHQVLTDFSFSIKGNEKIAIVGRNGAGKSTLLSVIDGSCRTDQTDGHPERDVRFSRAVTIGTYSQIIPEGDEDKTPDLLVNEAADIQCIPRESPLFSAFVKDFYRSFTRLGFCMEDRTKALREFSGGERTKILLLRLFLMQPDILLLDEPTNHLDLDTVEWLEEQVRKYKKAVVCVSHDRYFIDRTAEVVWEVEGGKLTKYAGNYSQYRVEKTKRYAKALRQYKAQEEEAARLGELIKKFRGKPRKAAFARSRAKILERMERIPRPEPDDAHIHTEEIIPARPGAKNVLDCDKLIIGYHARCQTPAGPAAFPEDTRDRGSSAGGLTPDETTAAPVSSRDSAVSDRGLAPKTVALRTVYFRLRRGQKIGIFGPNGTGKSTFLKTIAGKIPPLEGRLSVSETADIAYFDQMTAQLTSDKCVFDYFHDQFPALTGQETRKTLAGYLFRAEDMGKKVFALSGGEKARLVLACLLQTRPNVLLLDEPTNNMDIPAKETLESIFRMYRGTLVFISHDRYFLSHVAEELLYFPPDTDKVMYCPFGYEHWKEKQGVPTEDAAAMHAAEEQRMIEELRAVPKGTSMRPREIPTAALRLDWEFDQNKAARKPAEEKFAKASQKYTDAQACGFLADTQLSDPDILAEMYALDTPGDAEAFMSLDAYMNSDTDIMWEASLRQQLEDARDAWTKELLDWYDIFLDS